MLRLALRGLAARRRRAAACGVAVVLGVALAAGSLVLTASVDRSLAGRTDAALSGVAVVVSPKQIIDAKGRVPGPLPARVIERLRGVEGVDAVAGRSSHPPGWSTPMGRRSGPCWHRTC